MHTFDKQSVLRIARTVRTVERISGGDPKRRGKFDDLGMIQPTAAGQILVSTETEPDSGVYEWEEKPRPEPAAANQILVSVETAPSSGVYEWELRDAPATGTHVFMSVDGVADWVEVTEDFECPETSS